MHDVVVIHGMKTLCCVSGDAAQSPYHTLFGSKTSHFERQSKFPMKSFPTTNNQSLCTRRGVRTDEYNNSPFLVVGNK